ncbi:LacI family DNA-binding transcriptional regulator [Pseudodesulfovibrio indicus]|uniref:LacI family transcriptional regulator n=1 Tax=Pseudodesulfovibrio indicus TaxID=1716143 RepID=A0A126QS69_9BACT|nr:LacI family DNA-binding transcriptional regulator [Pseudodesulfovibrio indicus]AMK12722.1 LacI family transcriptional regulator [Pseudodesulfovibrio indicus]TDT86796.1 LacI family transcriptional regulator [Pseudodesulfovibrio indicus]
MTPFTIKDLARELGVSPSTVSRALRDHPDISPATKRRVTEAAQRHNYHPNQLAQSLQKKRSNTIGVIVPEIRHHFFSNVISGIEEVAYDNGYIIMVCQSNETLAREIINVQALAANRVAGLLIAISSETTRYEHLSGVIRQNVPLVQFDRVVESLDTGKVVVDDYAAAYGAVVHLIESGYRRIGHMAGQEGISLNRHRFEGYRDALADHGLVLEEKFHLHGGYREEDGRDGAERYLSMDELPEAILAINDPVAVGLYTRFKEAGVRIPEDVALVGFSDTPEAALLDPALTTVFQPAQEMGRAAVSLLLRQFEEGADFSPAPVTLPTELMVRGTSAPRRRP